MNSKTFESPSDTPTSGDAEPTFGCKRAGGFVDSNCLALCNCDTTMRLAALKPEAAPAVARDALEPWRDELSEIIGHLGSAIVQSCAKDDQIIMDHVKAAHEIAKIVRRKA